MVVDGQCEKTGERKLARGRALITVATLLFMLGGCGGAPVRGNLEPPPALGTVTRAPSAETAPTTVEATVITRPRGRSVYRIIRVKIPRGIDSLSLVLPDDSLPAMIQPTAFTSTSGGEKDCSEGIFSCSKLVSETVTAVVAAILALLGLSKVLRKKRRTR